MWRLVIVAVAVAAVAGCNPRKPAQPQAGNGEADTPPVVFESAKTALNIGDMEAAIFVEGRPALDPPIPNLRVDNLETIDGTVRMTTVDIDPPFPDQLPVAYRVEAKSDFMSDGVAAVRFTVYREVDGKETVLGSFSTVALGPLVMDQRVWPLDFSVNALEGLETPPESMLLTVRGSIHLLPPDVDQATLDPETVEVAPERTSKALRANPVRVNFHQPEGAAPAGAQPNTPAANPEPEAAS